MTASPRTPRQRPPTTTPAPAAPAPTTAPLHTIHLRGLDTVRALRAVIATSSPHGDDYLRTCNLRVQQLPGWIATLPSTQRDVALLTLAFIADLYAAIARLADLTARHSHQE